MYWVCYVIGINCYNYCLNRDVIDECVISYLFRNVIYYIINMCVRGYNGFNNFINNIKVFRGI